MNRTTKDDENIDRVVIEWMSKFVKQKKLSDDWECYWCVTQWWAKWKCQFTWMNVTLTNCENEFLM